MRVLTLKFSTAALGLGLGLISPAPVRADDGGNKIRHVLVISIDGMHSHDMQTWIANNPTSALAGLAATGVNYTNAFTTQPSDSIPSTVGIFTGASPSLGGMYYDDAWHRVWAPPPAKGACVTGVANGTLIDLKQGIDVSPILERSIYVLSPDLMRRNTP